jgi:hypothetical protein
MAKNLFPDSVTVAKSRNLKIVRVMEFAIVAMDDEGNDIHVAQYCDNEREALDAIADA